MTIRDLLTLAALTLCGLFFNGCASTPSAAPPVTASLVRAGVRQKADGPALAAGRSLFLNRCIQCHALPDVSRLTTGRLNVVIPIMTQRAKMTAEQHDTLRKYLLTVHSFRE
jgi:hypothetical protein